MQKFILRNRNHITLICAVLIAFAFIAGWTADNTNLFTWPLVFSSVIGALPIVIQAYQAIRVKVVSIDVL
ncbi:MAG TPA: cation-transporting P-type ATPase, partial [Clostridiaceae bacterium]|nr:cation-transporting P-type ATPase [Clostridiaceae bacterium]